LRVFMVAERMLMKSTTGLKECGLVMPRPDSGEPVMLEMMEPACEKHLSPRIGELVGETDRLERVNHAHEMSAS
jgi:hypothetical protein